MKTSNLFGLQFYNESKYKLIDQYIHRDIIGGQQEKQSPFLIFTPNPEQIVLAHEDASFAAALQKADILIPDGVGLIAASKLLAAVGKGDALRGRISGIDLLQMIVQRFPESRPVIIGGRGSKSVKVAGVEVPWMSTYENVQHPTEAEEKSLEQFLKKEKPMVVFVAFGAPHQEYWSIRHAALLEKYGVKLVLVVGGAVDVLAGKLKRAPEFIQFIGLEWLFRLIQEPWRWRRQLKLLSFIRLTLTPR